ncbi:choline-sulfatase [Tatumella ptyseos ATCC 33301]|uniref:Choline-sulfatase n=2 Tax=Tatumella ptyseos TaxID=82987 RepID=A0A085JPX9_9GAMM|nr:MULTISPECIES: sulfatase [Tatumella]KFD22525.1 choline-sulfatase [Tatumella ptyseos ATCC 33301]SQK72204.1 Arylsulfatase [Tatumella ptyseos]
MMKPLLLSSMITGMLIAPSVNAVNTHFQPQISSDRPNIILIATEDMNARIGAFGDKVANTPNLDALAKESVRFTNAFTMAGVSAPSRAGLITGVFSHTIGLQHMRTATRPEGAYVGVPPSWVKGYPELLRRSGYFTYNDTKTDYQFTRGHADVGPFSLWSEHGDYGNMDDLRVPVAWRNYDLQGKPFFMNFNPQITHESALFSDNNTPQGFEYITKVWNELRSHYRYTPTDPANVVIEPWLVDTPDTRQELAQLYDNVQVMDQQVGNLIRALKKDKLWDNTIVIFTADNGDGLPRKKREGYDSGTHVPMMIHIPAKYRPAGWPADGSSDDRLISFEDLAPTLLGYAGVQVPDYMKGIDLSKDNAPRREYVYGSRGRMDNLKMRSLFVRDKNFQYVRNLDSTPGGASIPFRNALRSMHDLVNAQQNKQLNPAQQAWFEPRPAEEFYDLRKDPAQLKNVITDSAYRAEIARFRQAMDDWRDQGNDTNLIDEGQMVTDLLDTQGRQHVTLSPVVMQDEVNHKIYLSNRTENASIGYSWDGKTWQLYTGAITPRSDKSVLHFKAVRYGWQESPSEQWTPAH